MQFQDEVDQLEQIRMGLWRKLFRRLKPYYKNIAIVMGMMALSAAADVSYPLMTKYAIDHFIARGVTEGIGWFAALYLAVVCCQGAVIWTHVHVTGRTEVGVCYTIRQAAFKKLQELSFNYYDKTPVGYILARMTSDAQRIADIVAWALLDISWGLLMMLFSLGVMFAINWKFALVVLVSTPLIGVVSAYFSGRILKAHREVRRMNSRITGAFNEGIMGAKTTKTLVREEANYGEFCELTGGMRRASIRAAVISSIYMPICMTIGSVVSAYLLSKGGHDVYIGALSYGTLTMFVSYAAQFFEPVREVARVFAEFQSAQAAAERILSLLEMEPQIVDRPEVIEKYGDQFSPKRENWEPIRGEIEFRDVTFQYDGGEKVLEDFSLHVRPGETIALVGETGSGKSTIVNLVCRFYEPTKGQIMIDGKDCRDRSQLWLQSNLGYVLQTPHLFSGTIRENIRYGRLDATDQEVEEAARMVDAEGFIMKLEKGYDTDVGEGGNRLSTGEKQLISFARAILTNPAIFVLDEATSSIDTETEVLIQKAIARVLSGRTSFIVAHRLSTIRAADRILVIQRGRITESGTHRQLLEKKGYYYNLYTNQFKEEGELSALGKLYGESGT